MHNPQLSLYPPGEPGIFLPYSWDYGLQIFSPNITHINPGGPGQGLIHITYFTGSQQGLYKPQQYHIVYRTIAGADTSPGITQACLVGQPPMSNCTKNAPTAITNASVGHAEHSEI